MAEIGLEQQFDALYKQIEEDIKKLPQKNYNAKLSLKPQKESLIHLHIRFPVLKGYDSALLKDMDIKTKIKLFDYIWNRTDYSDVMSWVLAQTLKINVRNLYPYFRTLKSWMERVENWWHSDMLSNIYSKFVEYELVESNSDGVFNTLKKWNSSGSSWKRRQSVVSLLYYSSIRKDYLGYESLIKPVENLLEDDDYYVQKAVGWTIREIFNLYPDKIKKFLIKHATDIAPAGWYAATEKLDKEFKKELMLIRKRKNV